MGSIHDWSKIAATNATADAAINWAENQLPSTVNGSARQVMARVKELLEDLSPLRSSTGAVNVYAVAIASPATAYTAGLKFAFKAHLSNTGACTVNVNNIGAKPLRRVSGADLAGSAISIGKTYVGSYIAASDEVLLESSDLDGNSLNSPAFTGVPTAPTAAEGSNTTQLATTAFVSNAVSDLNTATTNALALKAAIASPTFTGLPKAPTAAQGVNTTQLATTAHVFAYRPPNLSTAPGSAPSYGVRAFAAVSDTNAVLYDGNVSSVTDLGLGQARVNFTVAATTANFAAVASCQNNVVIASVVAKLTTSMTVNLMSFSGNLSDQDFYVMGIW